MFEYEFLRNQWVFVSRIWRIGGGILCGSALLRLPSGRERERKQIRHPDEYETNYMSVWQGIPWSVKVTIALIFVFAVIYSIHAVLHPNSW